jgi:hypothetical protein
MLNRLLKKTQARLQKHVSGSSFLQKSYIFLLSFLRPLYFTDEWLIVRNLKLKSKSRYGSILFFSVNKSASTFITSTVFKLLGSRHLKQLKFSGLFSDKKQNEYYSDPIMMKRILKEKGYFYTFRSYYKTFPSLEKYKILLVLRDPRDVLTSQYFSIVYNHPLSRKEVFERRQKYAAVSIDDFVLEYAPRLKQKYSDYCNYLLGKENVLFLKYEDMITNFGPWLRKLSSFLEISGNDEMINKIVSETSFVVKKEDPRSFIRNIKAGDHLNKLKPETIEKLSSMFSEELIKLDYKVLTHINT